jgi:hypothetical protein
MLYPDAHSERFVVHDFYLEHGRLPEPEEFEGTYGDVKRFPLPLEVAQSDYEGLVTYGGFEDALAALFGPIPVRAERDHAPWADRGGLE